MMIRVILVALLLVGCNDIERNQERNRLIGVAWDKAEMIDVTYYKSKSSDRFLESFEMDGYKFVIFNNGYGSAMQAIPLDNNAEYIRMLEEENQLLGETLAEYSINYE